MNDFAEVPVSPSMGELDPDEWERRVQLLAGHAKDHGWTDGTMWHLMELCINDRATITADGHPAVLDADLALRMFMDEQGEGGV